MSNQNRRYNIMLFFFAQSILLLMEEVLPEVEVQDIDYELVQPIENQQEQEDFITS